MTRSARRDAPRAALNKAEYPAHLFFMEVMLAVNNGKWLKLAAAL
jgi:hypothetical protein